MATPFSEIYELFLSQLTDYDLSAMDDVTLEENLQDWLLSAIGFFSNCKKDLRDYDKSNSQFNVELDSNEKHILSKFMLYVYVNTHVITEQNMKQSMNSKDYRMYSPANQLKALLELKQQINSEANTLMSRYSYNIHTLKDTWKS